MTNMRRYLPLPSLFPTLLSNSVLAGVMTDDCRVGRASTVYIHNAAFGVTLTTLPLAAIHDVFLGEPADDRYGSWNYTRAGM